MSGVLADVPALPLHEAGKYVAGAYVVLFALVLIYVAIMAIRLSRIERELGELLELSESTVGGAPGGAAGTSSPRDGDLARPETRQA
ncbi:MAG: hypothetical protein JWN81_1761 [Solirubrobacterales bacterium]|nr:hypothetical protein [Solirubrobacterales bacterium]